MSGLPVAALRRFVRPDTTPRCELCNAELGEPHRHLVGEDGHVACACHPCHLLFDHEDGRWAAVGDRCVADAGVPVRTWDDLGLPVGLAVLHDDGDGPQVRFPGPAGLVDGSLPAAATRGLPAASPLFGLLRPRVETVLARREPDRVRLLLVPVTAAYALVTELREAWQGFDGGPGAEQVVTTTFERLERRAEQLR